MTTRVASGPEFSEMDVLVIIAEQLPIRQALRLLWWDMGTNRDLLGDWINHPSMTWWITKHANEVRAECCKGRASWETI